MAPMRWTSVLMTVRIIQRRRQQLLVQPLMLRVVGRQRGGCEFVSPRRRARCSSDLGLCGLLLALLDGLVERHLDPLLLLRNQKRRHLQLPLLGLQVGVHALGRRRRAAVHVGVLRRQRRALKHWGAGRSHTDGRVVS